MTLPPVDPDTAARIADALLDTGCVAVNADTPFTLTSGRKSPVYIDCRRVISFLPERRMMIDAAAARLAAAVDMDAVDYIAGGETAGIPYAAWISEAMGKPMLYVRKTPKGFGRGARIEGYLPDGARVLLVEDLASNGGSKAAFADALRDGGAVVEDAFALFFYGIYRDAGDVLAAAGLRLHHLCTWHDILARINARALFDAGTRTAVARFVEDPAAWQDLPPAARVISA